MHTTDISATIASQRRADHEARATQHRLARSVRDARRAERIELAMATSTGPHRSWAARVTGAVAGAVTGILSIRRGSAPATASPAAASAR